MKESIIGKIAKGYSDSSQMYVEGRIYHHLANGINVITPNGLVFIETGKYEIKGDNQHETI